MIKLIVGSKGSGKTKKIIDLANNVDTQQKHVIFITDTNRYVYEIKHGVRFINSTEYDIINNADNLVAFISGLIAGDSDLDPIFIDGIARIAKQNVDELEKFFKKIEDVTKDAEVIFTISMAPSELPSFMKKYKEI